MAMSPRKRSSCPRANRLVECSNCGVQRGLNAQSCRRCGAVFGCCGPKSVSVPNSVAGKVRPEYAVGRLVHATSGAHQMEAEMIQALLLEGGIPSVIRRSPGFDVPGFLAAGPRDVLVCESAQRAASEVLLNASVPRSDKPPPASLTHAAVLFTAILLVAFCASMVAWLL
jgi:hypothetical protein